MRRIWHPFTRWEEYRAGMWRKVSGKDRAAFLSRAVEFTGDPDLYGAAMLRVIREWPTSCEHNLTDTASNRKAWVGHAACCLAIGCPEDITREAWGHLSRDQQDRANARAQEAIDIWVEAHEGRCPFGQMRFEWEPA